MDPAEMSNEENYAFDVAGYLHVPAVLSRSMVNALNQALDAANEPEGMLGWPGPQRELFRDLLIQPQLVWYLNQLIGPGFRLDQAPRLLGDHAREMGASLIGGDEPRNHSRAYFQQNGHRSAQGLKAIWVLEAIAARRPTRKLPSCSLKTMEATLGCITTISMIAKRVFGNSLAPFSMAEAWAKPTPSTGSEPR